MMKHPYQCDLQLFGAMEDEAVDTAQELLHDYPGMDSQDAIAVATLAELRRLNDSLGSLEVKLADIGRLAECINERGQFCITGTMTTYEG